MGLFCPAGPNYVGPKTTALQKSVRFVIYTIDNKLIPVIIVIIMRFSTESVKEWRIDNNIHGGQRNNIKEHTAM